MTAGTFDGDNVRATGNAQEQGNHGSQVTEVPVAAPRSTLRPFERSGRIGKYLLLRRIAQGGFATVFEAWDEAQHRSVAIKVSTEPVAICSVAPLDYSLALLNESEQLENQMMELQAYRLLRFGARSSYIPKFFESGLIRTDEDEVHTYLVMEVMGRSLGSAWRCHCEKEGYCVHACTRRNKEYFFELAHAMLDALKHLHCSGLVHRDIKPHNFCLRKASAPGGAPQVCIIDFGYLKPRPRTPQEANERDRFVGTPDYASIRSLENKRQGPRDDIESLGYALIEMYAGDLPWDLAPPAGVEWSYEVLLGVARAKSQQLKDQSVDKAHAPVACNTAPRNYKRAAVLQQIQQAPCSQLSPPSGQPQAIQIPTFLKDWIRYAMRMSALEQPNYIYLHALLDHGARELADAGLLQAQPTSYGLQQQEEVMAACGARQGAKDGWEAEPGQESVGVVKSFCGVASGSGNAWSNSNSVHAGSAGGSGSWSEPSQSHADSCVESMGDAGGSGAEGFGATGSGAECSGVSDGSGPESSSCAKGSSQGSGCPQVEEASGGVLRGSGQWSSGCGARGSPGRQEVKRRRVNEGHAGMVRLSLE